MPGFDALVEWATHLADAAIAGGIAVAIALGIHIGLFTVLRRIVHLSQGNTDDTIIERLRHPARWSLIAVAISIASESSPGLARIWAEIGRFVVPALLGWTVYALIQAVATAIENRADLSTDELVRRSRKTRVTILSRTAGFVIVVITIALILFNVPAVRSIGVTLLASAGVAALAVGAAAQPALKSLIAGLQMAITEPIRLGDLVVIDGESGRIEDIRMSYVVLRTGDERRVIVPTSKFLDTTFENWTRVAGGITGSVTLPVKPCPPIAPIRAAYLEALAKREEWDQRTGALHVAEAKVGSVDLRLVMSAADPALLDKLRVAMRETMLEWMREHMPESLCDEV